MNSTGKTRYLFVDESGDPTLFDGRGRIIAGQPGCSSHFIMGALDVSEPPVLVQAMSSLHSAIKADPYFTGVESLRPERHKTFKLLHAKDDLPEIRERVFRLLAAQDVRFYAVVRDKRGYAVHVGNLNEQSPTYHYTPNRFYDEMVRRLFRDRLHKNDRYHIVFARRGSKDRTQALEEALMDARANFRKKWGITSSAPIEVSALHSHEHYCLQAVDYFLWALMRVYSRGEDRFLRLLWPRCANVHDVDDRRTSQAGCYYSQRNPLTAACIKREPGI
jgi:hypothetical protein